MPHTHDTRATDSIIRSGQKDTEASITCNLQFAFYVAENIGILFFLEKKLFLNPMNNVFKPAFAIITDQVAK